MLYHLGALDYEGLLTRMGRKMAEFPLDPSMSKVLLASVDLDEHITTIVLLLNPYSFNHKLRLLPISTQGNPDIDPSNKIFNILLSK